MTNLSKLYEQYAKQVYRFLFALSGERDLAEELTQETFYQAFLHIDKFENRCSVFTWLCQIGKNAFFKEQKRRKRMVSSENLNEYTKDFTTNPEEFFIEQEQVKYIRKHLSHLPEPYRTVFTLRIYGKTDYREIAKLYDKSESWARVTYFRAKEQLFTRIKSEENL